MRIAFIVDSFPILSETFILNQITGLIELGHDVEIFAGFRPRENKIHSETKEYNLLEHTHYHNDKPLNRCKRGIKGMKLLLQNIWKNPGVILRALNFIRYGKEALSLTLLYRAALFLRTGEFDIIFCHFATNGNLGALMKELGIKGKLVAMFHGYDIRLGIKEGGEIYHKLFKYGDCFLSISDYNYRHMVMFGADPRRIIHHSVGIDLGKFSFREGSDSARRSGKPVRILTVGRLIQEKGLNYGIHALHKLLHDKDSRNLEYRIIGDGPLMEELHEMVRELNLTQSVHFLGPRENDQVITFLRESDIFLLPSIAEALPVSLMEAQAVGLPVVATSVGSVSQVVDAGKSGFLVPERDVDAMAERLGYLIEHPEVWPEMGQAGRKFVEEHYNIDKLNDRLVEIFRGLLDGRLP